MGPLGLAIISVIIVVVAAYLTITKILPMVRDLLVGLFNDNRTLGALMSLLIVVIYILVISVVVDLLLKVEGNSYLAYLNVITPGIDILTGILPYVKYIILGALIAWGFKSRGK